MAEFDLNDWVRDQQLKVYRQVLDAQERYLLAFFGSFEAAQEFGHLYELEETITYDTSEENILRVTNSYRLKLKSAKAAHDHESWGKQ